MKLLATIYPARSIEWRIKVESKPNPRGVEPDENRPLLDVWVPNDPKGKTESYLIYNPRIALIGKPRFDSRFPDARDIFMPVTLLYAFANKLAIAYEMLSRPGMYRRDGGQLYMDMKLCRDATQKLSVYHGSVLITPTIIPPSRGNGELIGVQFSMDGAFAGTMSHTEVREFCEVLSHTDIQTYSLILSTFEKLDLMDRKLDALQAGQQQILELLMQRGEPVERAKIKEPGFEWKPVMR